MAHHLPPEPVHVHAHAGPGQPRRRPGRRGRRLLGDQGMSTAEYAVGTVAACGFAGLLVKLLTSGGVEAMLRGILERALSVVG